MTECVRIAHASIRTVRRQSVRAATAILAGALCSCATLSGGDPLQVNVAGVEPLQGEGLELRFNVQVRVQNPNDEPIEYDGVALQLDLNGHKFGTGVSSAVGSVPRYGETVITIPVTVGAFSMARQVLGLMNGGDTKAVAYKVSGKLEGGLFGTKRFESKGSIDLPNLAEPR